MNTKAHSQQISGSPLKRIVEGKIPSCPTLLDLNRLARKRANPAASTTITGDQERWVDEHLATCDQCLHAYEGLVTLIKASGKAIDAVASPVGSSPEV